jgi:hypothetical protein
VAHAYHRLDQDGVTGVSTAGGIASNDASFVVSRSGFAFDLICQVCSSYQFICVYQIVILEIAISLNDSSLTLISISFVPFIPLCSFSSIIPGCY